MRPRDFRRSPRDSRTPLGVTQDSSSASNTTPTPNFNGTEMKFVIDIFAGVGHVCAVVLIFVCARVF